MTSTPPPGREWSDRLVSRRTALLGGFVALGAVACGAAPPAAAPTPSRTPTPAPTPTPTPTTAPPPPPEPRLDDVPAYALLAGEVEPACKQAATAFVSAALTAGTASTAGAPLPGRLAALGQDAGPAAALTPLVPSPGASIVEIVYPQYGGITAVRDTACVMVVAEQTFLTRTGPATPQRRSLTLDVRLRRSGDRWAVTEVRPAQLPTAVPTLSTSAQDVLESGRIVLPDAARADVAAGRVHDTVTDALLALAEDWRIDVSVLTSGHPDNVWATDRVSHHTHGKAVDVWALDGVPVIDRAGCPWEAFVRAAATAGATEIGSPRVVGVRGGFADEVHQDHIHLGFGRARRG